MARLSYCNRRFAISQPPFSGPTIWSLGTRTSVKKVSQNGDTPEISLIGPPLDTRRLHVDEDERNAALFHRAIGAHQTKHPIGKMGIAGPDLLAVNQPIVALCPRSGFAARQDRIPHSAPNTPGTNEFHRARWAEGRGGAAAPCRIRTKSVQASTGRKELIAGGADMLRSSSASTQASASPSPAPP